jgi:hypothetical protein
MPFTNYRDHPARRRDRRLAQTRRLSLCVAAGAAAASIGLGGAFAHALPGHPHLVASPAQTGTRQQGSGQPSGGTQSAPTTQPTGSGATSPAAARPRLSAPAQPPAPAPQAPPHTTSGGS